MRKVAVIAIALALLAFACKKTEKGENQRWKSATAKVDKLKVLYPGFASALAEQYNMAKTIRDQAEAISDEEDRIARMSEANNLLSRGFVEELGAIDAKQKAIQSKIVEVTTKVKEMSDRAGAQQAADNAKRTIAQVDAALKKGAPDARSAAVIVSKATTDLDAAEKLLAQVAQSAASKEAGQQPTAGTGTTGTAPAAGKADPAAEKWTCEYCDHVNEHDHDACANCGAARPAKK